MSVANQKIVHINKPTYDKKFLQIGIDEWQRAQSQMNYSTFVFYLYLAGNANGFDLELSQKAFEKATGFKKTSYHDAINNLQELGYLVQKQGNIFYFFTSPVRSGGEITKPPRASSPERVTQSKEIRSGGDRFNKPQPPPQRPAPAAQPDGAVRPSNREIDKTDIKDKIDTPIIQKEKEGNEKPLFDNGQIKEEITTYISPLSDYQKNEFAKISREFINKGKSPLWIKIAITHKPVSDWAKWGFGLFRNADFIEEIDALAEEEIKKKKECEEEKNRIFEVIREQLEQPAKILVVKKRPRRKYREDIDLSTLMDD